MRKRKDKENSHPLNILVVDHDPRTYKALQAAKIEDNIRNVMSLHEALSESRNTAYDIILLKDRLPDGSACDVVVEMQKTANSPDLLVYSKHGDPHEAELILNSGCWDYIVDPALPKGIAGHLKKLISYRRNISKKVKNKHGSMYRELRSEGIVGNSQLLQHCLNLMVKAAQSDANILISGESGTGKELFAASIHAVSSRANNEFIVVDCAALAPTLIESILFGHVKGSFTGADRNKGGLIKKADGGTLFLDEIGELPMEMQKKFLRVLQEQSFRPVGSNIEVKSNFRLIAATNKNLYELSQKHEFREDLLFRIQTFRLELPPLRERKEDITELAYYFRDQFCRRDKIEKNFSTAFLMVLKQYDWPGNVRELFHAMERAFAAAVDSDLLFPLHLPPEIRIKVTHKALENQHEKHAARGSRAGGLEFSQDLQTYRDNAVEEAERNYLLELVAFTGGNLKKCLEISGLSRSRFYALLKKYGISLKSTFITPASSD